MNETIQILADGSEFIIATPYTPSESRAGVVRKHFLLTHNAADTIHRFSY